jgi:hypothetical protein
MGVSMLAELSYLYNARILYYIHYNVFYNNAFARCRRKRTFQFSYRGWSTISERIYALLCVYNFFYTIFYYVKECKFGEVCVCVVYAYTLYEVKIRRGTPMRCGTATTVIFRRRKRENERETVRAIREEERPTADSISRFHGQ